MTDNEASLVAARAERLVSSPLPLPDCLDYNLKIVVSGPLLKSLRISKTWLLYAKKLLIFLLGGNINIQKPKQNLSVETTLALVAF